MKKYRVSNTLDYKSENKIVHEYTIIQTVNEEGHEVTTLYRSNDDVWSEGNRGEELFSLIDTGDDVRFPKKEFANTVGYDRFAELYIVLAFLNKTERMPLYQGVAEEIDQHKTYEI